MERQFLVLRFSAPVHYKEVCSIYSYLQFYQSVEALLGKCMFSDMMSLSAQASCPCQAHFSKGCKRD